MFDLDILASTMNYVPVREENQVVHNEEELQYIVHGVNIRSDDVPDEEPKKKSIVERQSTVDSDFKLSNEDQAIQDELNRMLFQDTIAKSYEDDQRGAYEEAKKKARVTDNSDSTLIQSSAKPVDSTFNVFNTSNDADTNTDDLDDPSMPELEEIDDELTDEGIFSNSHEDLDFTNLEDDLAIPMNSYVKNS